MNRPARTLLGVVIVPLAAVMTACGNDDPASGGGLTRAQLITSVDRICAASSIANEPLEDAAFGQGYPPPLDRWAQFWPALASNESAAVVRLRQLRPPPADQAKFNQWIEAFDGIIPLFRQAGQKAAAGDQAGHDAALTEIEQAGAAVEEAARSYGFKECGSDEDK